MIEMKERSTHEAMCQNSTEENKRRYFSLRHNAKKAVSKTMSEKAKEELTELQNCPCWMFWLVKRLRYVNVHPQQN